MGGGQSKPDPVPMAFNIYVTNKTQGIEHLFVRVQGDKLKEHEMYSRTSSETSVSLSAGGKSGTGGKGGASAGGNVGLNISHRQEEEQKERQVFDSLKQGGFNLLPLDVPTPFALENHTIAYISVHDGSLKSWNTDMPVSPKTFSCVTVTGDQNGINVQPSNPKPRWFQLNEKADSSLISQGLVEVYSRQSPRYTVYFGKFTVSTENLPPITLVSHLCGVRIEPGKPCCFTDMPPLENVCKEGTVLSIDVLANPGYEWVKAQRGNTVRPNAVKTSVYISKKREERYLGRINGDIVCGITEVDGMIDYFVPYEGSKTTSGEILLLTSDPNIRPNTPAIVQKKRDEVDTEEIKSKPRNENSIISRFRAAATSSIARQLALFLVFNIVSYAVYMVYIALFVNK